MPRISAVDIKKAKKYNVQLDISNLAREFNDNKVNVFDLLGQAKNNIKDISQTLAYIKYAEDEYKKNPNADTLGYINDYKEAAKNKLGITDSQLEDFNKEVIKEDSEIKPIEEPAPVKEEQIKERNGLEVDSAFLKNCAANAYETFKNFGAKRQYPKDITKESSLENVFTLFYEAQLFNTVGMKVFDMDYGKVMDDARDYLDSIGVSVIKSDLYYNEMFKFDKNTNVIKMEGDPVSFKEGNFIQNYGTKTAKEYLKNNPEFANVDINEVTPAKYEDKLDFNVINQKAVEERQRIAAEKAEKERIQKEAEKARKKQESKEKFEELRNQPKNKEIEKAFAALRNTRAKYYSENNGFVRFAANLFGYPKKVAQQAAYIDSLKEKMSEAGISQDDIAKTEPKVDERDFQRTVIKLMNKNDKIDFDKIYSANNITRAYAILKNKGVDFDAGQLKMASEEVDRRENIYDEDTPDVEDFLEEEERERGNKVDQLDQNKLHNDLAERTNPENANKNISQKQGPNDPTVNKQKELE